MKPVAVHVAGAGLFAGAAAWAMHQQAGYIIAAWACGTATRNLWLVGAAALILLTMGAWLSWRALQSLAIDHANNIDSLRPRTFLALIGLMAAPLFLFAVFLQAGAPLFLPGCIG
jgi:ABC-type nickel/cobalt efflux system permease component RcnA